MELLTDIVSSFAVVLQPQFLFLIFTGVMIGMAGGLLPGITSLNTIVLVLPFTYFMDITPAVLFLLGVYAGGIFGGATTAILFNIPADTNNVATCWDGYPLQRKGFGKLAIGAAIVASAVGGLASALIATTFAPVIAQFALKFSTAEYFAVIFMGLSSATLIGSGSVTKAIVAVSAGMLLGTVGLDPMYGTPRLTFGWDLLRPGINWIPVMIGVYALGEVLYRIDAREEEIADPGQVGIVTRLPKFSTIWGLRHTLLRGTAIGTVIGIIPAAGAAVAAFVAYGVEKQTHKRGREFGSGVLEGVVAPETANNASSGGAMIPLLALGIPGSGSTAVLLAAFLLHGVDPGPRLFVTNPDLVHTIFAGLIVANLLMVIAGMFSATLLIQLLRIPMTFLMPFIAIFCFIGAYALRNDLTDVWVATMFGVLGYFMRRHGFPIAPLVLGTILGPLAEDSFRTTMVAYHNDLTIFVTRPISGSILALAAVLMAWPWIVAWRKRRKPASAMEEILELLDKHIRIEEVTQNFYQTAARHFAANPSLCTFWRHMAAEESQHVRLLVQCREVVLRHGPFESRLVTRGDSGLLPEALVARAGSEPSDYFDQIATCQTRLETASVTTDDVFEMVLALESSEVHETYKMFLRVLPEPFAEVFTNIYNEFDHKEDIEDAVRTFTSRPDLLAKGSQLPRLSDSVEMAAVRERQS